MRPGFHHHHAVADGQRLGLVVRDHDGGGADLALDAAQLELHLLAQLGVEVGERLVEQQNRRRDHERACDRDALALAAGQLARIAVGECARAARAPASARTRSVARPAATRRISRPKLTFSATVMCGNSA